MIGVRLETFLLQAPAGFHIIGSDVDKRGKCPFLMSLHF